MKQKICLLCEDVIEDAENHLNSLIRIFDELTVNKFPSVIPKICFFANLMKSQFEAETFKGEVIIKQGGIKFQSFNIDLDFMGKNKLNVIFRLAMFQVVRKGELEISLIKDKETIASASIKISYDVPLISKGFVDPVKIM